MPASPGRTFAGVGIAFLCLASPSCFTASTLRWTRDEVTFLCASSEGGGRGHLYFSVKNIEGVSEGLDVFEIVVPPAWAEEPRVEGDDGILRLAEPLPESACVFNLQDVTTGRVALRLTNRTAAKPPPARSLPHAGGDPLPRLGYELHRRGRSYSVSVYGELVDEARWVRLGTLPLGRGQQSRARRVLGLLALPASVVLDVVTFAFLFVLLDDSRFYL